MGRLSRELNQALSGVMGGQEAPRLAEARWHTSARASPIATPTRPTLAHLNAPCSIDDWKNPAFVETVRRLLPYFVGPFPDFPSQQQHRKHWESAHTVLGLEQLGVVHEAAVILAVGAGHEEIAYDLSTKIRWVFVTDIYGTGPFSSVESDPRMLVDPGFFARCPYNRNRMVVQYMNGLDLRYEPDTFDAVYSLSSIEHFGGLDQAKRALSEMHRVVKRGGVVAVTTECVVNEASGYSEPGLELFTPGTLQELLTSVDGLVPIEEARFIPGESTLCARRLSLTEARRAAGRRAEVYPHILLEHEGRVFTSVALFWVKR